MSEKNNSLDLIPERKKLFGITIDVLLSELLNFKNRTLIIFDLETLGLHPSFEYEQILEIAATAIDGDTRQTHSSIEYKVKLSDSSTEFLDDPDSIQRYSWEYRQKRRGKSAITNPHEIIKMTGYLENKSESHKEKNALKMFLEFVAGFDDPILVAHNSEFDLKYINTRCKMYGISVPMFNVLDTLKISKFFFVPLLNSYTSNEIENIKKILVKSSGHISSRLGDLASGFQVNADNWHSASSDTIILKEVLFKMISFLEKNKWVDIKDAQRDSINKTLKIRKRNHKR